MTFSRFTSVTIIAFALLAGTANAQSNRDQKDDISYRQKNFKNGRQYNDPKPNGPAEKRLKKYQEKKSKWALPDADTTSNR